MSIALHRAIGQFGGAVRTFARQGVPRRGHGSAIVRRNITSFDLSRPRREGRGRHGTDREAEDEAAPAARGGPVKPTGAPPRPHHRSGVVLPLGRPSSLPKIPTEAD